MGCGAGCSVLGSSEYSKVRWLSSSTQGGAMPVISGSLMSNGSVVGRVPGGTIGSVDDWLLVLVEGCLGCL